MKTKEMKTVTLEQFMKFGPCWLYEDGGEERLRTIAKRKKNWSASRSAANEGHIKLLIDLIKEA